MDQQAVDILVIGAGAAGLLAALEMAGRGKRIALLEARDRIGGRIFTLQHQGRPVELGAEFIHGNLPLTNHWLQKAGTASSEIRGSIWQHKNGQLEKKEDFIENYALLEKKFRDVKTDKPVAAFLQQNLNGEACAGLRSSVQNYVEGYYAADTANASTLALCRELTQGDEEQYRLQSGYATLVETLATACRKNGVSIFLSQAVRQMQWKKGAVAAITDAGKYKAEKLLITVPIGVLQNSGINFEPALPQMEDAVQHLGVGHVVKLVCHFSEAFWKNGRLPGGQNLSDLSFLFSVEEIPTWWTHYPSGEPVLTGWLAGPNAKAARSFTEEEVVEKGLRSLSAIFGPEPAWLRRCLVRAFTHNWSSDAWSGGAYSYEVVGGEEAMKTLLQPVENTLFFAGEGLQSGPQIGTVEGALASGRDAAHRLLSSFND